MTKSCASRRKRRAGAIDAPIDRDIEFRHVGFEYESKNPVLRDVSFTVKRGQTVAILGATGSGKSTLMLLLQRLYDVKRGEILIGGVNIRNIRKAHLARAYWAGASGTLPVFPLGKGQCGHCPARGPGRGNL